MCRSAVSISANEMRHIYAIESANFKLLDINMLMRAGRRE